MTPDIDALYREVFERDPAGRRILQHLIANYYDVEVFERGPDGDRMTAYKAGQRSVVGGILKKLGKVDK